MALRKYFVLIPESGDFISRKAGTLQYTLSAPPSCGNAPD